MADYVPPSPADGLDLQIARATPKVDFSTIGDLPKTFWEGQAAKSAQEQRDVFKNGIPDDPKQMLTDLARVQGAAAAPQLMQYYKMLFGQQADKDVNGPDTGPPQQVPPQQSQPMPPQSMPQQPGPVVPSSARVVGDNEGVASGLYAPAPGPGMRPPVQADVTPNQAVAARFPGAPALVAPSAVDPTLGGLVPPGRTPGQQRSLLSSKLASGMLTEAQAKDYQSRIDGIDKALQQYREGNVKNSELTPDQKNATDPSVLGFEKNKAIQAGAVKRSDALYEGIQAQSTQFDRDLRPYLEITKSVLNTPGMYTGIGGNLSLNINRVRAAFGDQKAAMLQEAMQKVTASSVLSQINNQRAQMQENGGTSGRIFSQQVDLVEKAAPAMSNTLGGNRFLVTVADRMGELGNKVAQMSRDYKQKNGILDSGFDQQLSDYMGKHPVFSTKELSHPEILGSPTVPSEISSKEQLNRWAASLGVRPGDPIRGPNGQVKKYNP